MNIPNEQQVAQIRAALAADRAVSHREADLLFSMKRNTPDLADRPDFTQLFVDGVTSFLLYTGETPGALDSAETVWLTERIAEDFDFDPLEKALLLNLADRAESLPANFHDLVRRFESRLQQDRLAATKHEPFLEQLKTALAW